ncbi:MAG: cyclic nucleotide-binding domain-containing protein, partial [Puniceicoccales bacterium]
MDQHHILTKAKLHLSEDIEASAPDGDVLILKQVPLKQYLVVDVDQWAFLKRFREATTLQELIPLLITERKCLPLRSLYELVLKAVVSGMLQVDGTAQTPAQRVKASEWDHRLRFGMAHWFGVVAILFGFGMLLFNPLEIPRNLFEILAGWLVICGSLTAGYFLSACLLVGFEREVYDVGFKWKHAFPHFHCNVEDARMGGRLCEMTVALMQMAPMFFICGVAALWYPHLVFILLLGIFYVTVPTGHSPACLLLRSVYRRYPLSTTRDFLFVQNRLFWTLLNARVKFTDKKYLLIFSTFTLAWLTTVCLGSVSAFDLNFAELTKQFVSTGMVKLTALIVLTIMGVLFLGSLGLLSWILAKNILNVWEEWQARRRTKLDFSQKLELTTEDIAAFFKKTLLLKGLDDHLLFEIAGRVRGLVVQPKKVVVRQGESGDDLFFVYDGGVEVLMELKSGRPLHVTDLEPG